MIATLKTQLTKRYASTGHLVRRDAHPKHHGLVRATFLVDEKRPIELRYGIFKQVRAFDALIRFSNSQPVVNHDLEMDIRGCAIKLQGAPRSMFETNVHDFILTTGDTFFGIDAVDFVDFPRASESGLKTFFYFMSRPRRWRGGLRLLAAMEQPDSPWNVEYFSQTPYRLGPHCVKYQLRPVTRRTSRGDPWYLKPGIRNIIGIVVRLPGIRRFARSVIGFDALAKSLAGDLQNPENPIELEFLVQRWPDLASMPVWAIENPTRRWQWKWERVATIQIPAQDAGERRTEAEVTAFNPWQVARIHRPLGGINRARMAIYAEMSRFRNAINARKAPTP